ncbi:hypothetical protein [Lapidilactobacillus gannanensis]|uniref:Uncharacterized protein n=1 Tax=Lapidilactobacillus gannanensis TaxID=2486002 RepID=A0ABW4BML6_9LACO|nr:hypothetical protein [Lapidilactobacillus gannanensis]
MKTKLPKAVGEELDFYKCSAYSFDEYYQEICNWEAIISTAYCNRDVKSDRDAQVINLLHAWINGWEEE